MAAHYLMLKPDESAGRRARGVAAEMKTQRQLRGRPTDWDRLHVTLAAVDPSEPGELRSLREALGELSMPPFVIALDRAVSFHRRGEARPLVLVGDDGVFGVRLLHDEIQERLHRKGIWLMPGVGGTPHLTLLRDHAAVPETFVPPVSWTVREVLLIESFVAQRRHVVRYKWPLRQVSPGLGDPSPPPAPRLC